MDYKCYQTHNCYRYYEEINIQNEGISREKLVELTGGRTVPQIIIDDKSIGGYDNLLVLDQKGELLN